MKLSRRVPGVVILTLLLALALPAMLAGAQEESIVVPEDLMGFYSLSAVSGTLTDNGDGTFALTLADVPEFVPWVTSAPKLAAGRHEIWYVAGSWAAAPEGLEGKAVLEIEGMSLWLTLSAPVYDSELSTLTFTAAVDEIVSAEESKETPKAPKSFEAATLFVQLDHEFGINFVAGSEARGSDTRELGGGGRSSGGWPG